MLRPDTIEALQAAIAELEHVRATGGGTKTALSAGANLSLAALSGIVEYEPDEFVITAKAGTPLAELETLLAEQGQYLPFDPPWVNAGATIGGTVATGLSGSGRLRYGGVRDFVIGVRLVTGESRLVRGGGKVVKNAAGFDIPKLTVGSLGRFGVLADVSLKVFPRPEAFATVKIDTADSSVALDVLCRLANSIMEPTCLDLLPPSRVVIRLGGMAESLPKRIERLRTFLAAEYSPAPNLNVVEEDATLWQDAREFAWVPAEHALLKIPLTLSKILPLEQAFGGLDFDCPCRYTVAGNVLWLAWPEGEDRASLDALLAENNCQGLALTGSSTVNSRVDALASHPFAEQLTQVFDPAGKFAAAISV